MLAYSLTDRDGFSQKFNPVASVCKNGDTRMREYLEKNAGINFMAKGLLPDQQTCVHLAVQKNRHDFTEQLLS